MWCWIDHLTSSEHWEQQESTVSPLDRTGLNIEGKVIIGEVSLRLNVEIVINDHGGGIYDVDGDHGGGFGDKMIFSKQL